MKQITKVSPDPGQKEFEVVNMDQENIYIHPPILPYTIVDPSESVATDVAFFDGEKVIIARVDDYSKLPLTWVPIGIVVVPGTHNVYGDGSCGVMSLKGMSCNTPDSGSTSLLSIYWGQDGTDISALSNLTQVPVGNTEDGIPTGINQSVDIYLPSDKFSSNPYQCLHDTDSYYSTSYSQIPSPYLTDGSRNPGYYQTTPPSSSNNALADFDGRGNSEILCDLATAQSDWKTASTITNNGGIGYSPAACCCWRFHTEGTQQGDWYLPAIGELGYIMPPFNKINETIKDIREVSGRGWPYFGILTDNGLYESSSEYNGDQYWAIGTHYGRIHNADKNANNATKAFLRVGPNGVIQKQN